MDLLNNTEVINPDILQKGTLYYVQEAQKIVTDDGAKIFVRIRLQEEHNVWVLLPQHLTYAIDGDILSVLNNQRYVYGLVYYGRTTSGTPIFDFEYFGGFPDPVGN
jgi:hypothetical protein